MGRGETEFATGDQILAYLYERIDSLKALHGQRRADQVVPEVPALEFLCLLPRLLKAQDVFPPVSSQYLSDHRPVKV